MAGRRTALDAAVAVFVLTIFWLPYASGAGYALAACAGAAVILCRREPVAATAVAAAVTVLGTILGVCRDPMLATAWCLAVAAYRSSLRWRNPAAPLVLLGSGLALVAAVPDRDPGRQILVAVVALTVAWLLGTLLARQVALAHLALAREVHDVVGHSLGVISAQAGVSRGLPDAGPEELRTALAEIETQARGALTEVQTLVRTMRAPSDLDQLLAAVRSAGLPVRANVEIPAGAGPAVRIVVHRIVQEALSNVLRHAPGASCSVDVRARRGSIVIVVQDDGPGISGAAGLGLRGMAERAELVGGTVSWENRAGGGFEVRACLPSRR